MDNTKGKTMRNAMAKLRSINPVYLLGVAMVSISVGLLSGVLLRAGSLAFAQIVGWF